VKLAPVALLAIALAACGGSVVSTPPDGGLRGSTPGDATTDTSASCSSPGALCPSCPADPTPGEACSFPAGMLCQGMLSCPGGLDEGPVDVECMEGRWGAVSKDSCPPTRCVAGGACSAGSCTLSGAGPCGSDELLTCDGGTYVLQSYPCNDEGAGCGTAGGGPGACSTSCTCTNGLEVCTSSGNCDAG